MTGIQGAMRAIRQVDHEAEIVHVEAVQLYSTRDPALDEEVRHWERRAQLPTRLLLGHVGPTDEDWSWLRTSRNRCSFAGAAEDGCGAS